MWASACDFFGGLMKNEEFIRFLKKTFKHGWKWFKRLKRKRKKKIKTIFITKRHDSRPIDSTKDIKIPTEAKTFKLEAGQAFSRNIIDIGGEYFYENNYLGQGFIIANLDEGLQPHEGIEHLEKPRRLIRKSFIPGQSNPFGEEKHGNHVTGLEVGKGRIITGLASEVDLYYQFKIMSSGMGFVDAFNNALKYLLDLSDDEFPDFIGSSLGVRLDENNKADDVKEAEELIRECHKKGAIITASAGNQGAPLWMPERYSIPRQTWPSTMPEVLAIANVGWDNKINELSSPGNITYAANGTDVVSFGSKPSEYILLTGTSMSRPIATGFMCATLTEAVVKDKTPKVLAKKKLHSILIEKKRVWDLMSVGYDSDVGYGMLSIKPQN